MSAAGQKTKQLPPYFQTADTRSQSSCKQHQDVETEITTLPSEKNINIFEDKYQIMPPQSRNLPDQKEGRKNHIFIRMSARINGVEFSPDNTKGYEGYQQNLRSNGGFKKLEERQAVRNDNSDKSRVFQKIVQKETEITRLKEENRKLTELNQQLKGETSQRKSIKSIDRFYPSILPTESGVKIYKKDQNYFSLADKLELEEMLNKTQQIKICLENKVLEIESVVLMKENAINDLMKQSQHEINLLYENLSKRLKAKQVELYMNSKKLKQEQDRIVSLKNQLRKIVDEKRILELTVANSMKEKQQLSVNLKKAEDEVRKGKIVGMRLQNTENQLKYYADQLKNVKRQRDETHTEIRRVRMELLKTKKQLSDTLISKTNNTNKADILLLKQSGYLKEQDIQKQQNQQPQILIIQKLQKQLITMTKRINQLNQLLAQANQKIMGLMLDNLDKIVSRSNL